MTINPMKIFGILNLSPDSFSGTGNWEGADVIDIGAESTRPGATPVSIEEEWSRLELALQGLQSAYELSLDTRHFEVAQKALKYGVKYLNDVTGFVDDHMAKIAADNNLCTVAMHSMSVPADPKVIMQTDPVPTIIGWAQETINRLTSLGVSRSCIIIDPGIGFGKTAEQSWDLIRNIGKITKSVHELGAKVLVGHSRKSFLASITQAKPEDRDIETALISNYLQTQGVDYIRVHNVALNRQALTIGEKLLPPQN